MRILYVITRAEIGGAQAHVLELLKGFRDHAELHLATGEEGPLCEQARALGVSVHILPHLVQPLHPIKDCGAVGNIRSLISRVRPDLMHMHSSKAGLVGRVAARLSGVPAVFTAHGFAFTEGVSQSRRIIAIISEWLAGRLGRQIIAVSDYDRRLALRYRIAPESRIVTIHNGVADIPSDLLATIFDASPVRLVMVARFAPPKDYASLLKALAELRHLPWEVELIGDGPLLTATQTLASQLELMPRVVFRGRCGQVAERLARAQLFVLISNYEGLPISILEAMRAGLPVIASKVGGVSEAVVDGHTGFLIPRGDLVTLQQRLQLLLTDSSLRRCLGSAGRRLFESHFTVERMIANTREVYERLLCSAK